MKNLSRCVKVLRKKSMEKCVCKDLAFPCLPSQTMETRPLPYLAAVLQSFNNLIFRNTTFLLKFVYLAYYFCECSWSILRILKRVQGSKNLRDNP